MSSPLGNLGNEMDHLAFLQEPMSDEEDDLDVENILKNSLPSNPVETTSDHDQGGVRNSLKDNEQKMEISSRE